MQKIWLLTDDRMGNVNQLLGIGEALQIPFERKEIRYNKWVKLPNFLRGSSLIGITAESRAQLTESWPDVVLSAGRRSYPVALHIHKKSGGKTKIVQLMNPGRLGFKKAALIVLPSHDKEPFYTRNVVRILGAPHRITADKLKTERQKWEPVFRDYPTPRLSVIVGGATKDKPFTDEMARQLVQDIKKQSAGSVGSVLLTTSRRTPKSVIQILKQELTHCPVFFYQFGDNTENPYFGLLSCADLILVTGDSISMCSECCAAGVPVLIFAPDTMIGSKHRRFLTDLFEKGYAVSADQPVGKRPETPLNPANQLAKLIHSFDK